ncbi:MAG: hypothetical protein A2138_22495 [Deltaproteobacteria bacterium RBG_16_71_12]|nr:MAG: hypothetical protein A2138_22495 [Deltaproteobacteria bacterium RBG_16_71_12]
MGAAAEPADGGYMSEKKLDRVARASEVIARLEPKIADRARRLLGDFDFYIDHGLAYGDDDVLDVANCIGLAASELQALEVDVREHATLPAPEEVLDAVEADGP